MHKENEMKPKTPQEAVNQEKQLDKMTPEELMNAYANRCAMIGDMMYRTLKMWHQMDQIQGLHRKLSKKVKRG